MDTLNTMSDLTYSSRHIASLFKISRETVRVWSREFSAYLSPTAQPEPGRHRNFTDEDLRVFSLVSDMKNRGSVYEDIHAALAAGQRGDPPLATARHIVGSETVTVLAQARARVADLERQVITLEQAIRPTQDENVKLKALLEYTQSELEKARQENRELLLKLGKAGLE